MWPPLGISALSALRVELASRGSTSSLRLGMGEREAGRRTATQQCGSWSGTETSQTRQRERKRDRKEASWKKSPRATLG